MLSATVGLAGAPLTVDRFHPMANAAQSAVAFELDGAEMLRVEAEVHRRGRTIVGVMHSHPQTTPYPSPTDLRAISQFDPAGEFLHLIVSLRHAEPSMRCYHVNSGTISEVLIVVVDDPDSVGDPQADASVAVAVAMSVSAQDSGSLPDSG